MQATFTQLPSIAALRTIVASISYETVNLFPREINSPFLLVRDLAFSSTSKFRFHFCTGVGASAVPSKIMPRLSSASKGLSLAERNVLEGARTQSIFEGKRLMSRNQQRQISRIARPSPSCRELQRRHVLLHANARKSSTLLRGSCSMMKINGGVISRC